MARKDLLKGLMDPAPAPATDITAPAKPRYTKGAIGAVGQSIAELKSRAVIELVADQIDAGGLQDRLEVDPEAHAQLMASIAEYGQQVPVLVRHDPNYEGRYQIVFGRRRVAALNELGVPVKAMVRDLTDQDLVIAQGQENTARKDLSFIEKVNFARQMQDAGYSRKIICDALSIDKTVISRMLQVAEAIPAELILAIGAAPSVGRDRWLGLAKRVEASSESVERIRERLVAMKAMTSDARFSSLLKLLTPTATKVEADPPRKFISEDGVAIGHAKVGKQETTLKLNREGGFDAWLLENIKRFHREWKTSGE
jgi:ParB family chromosome partitioning protein